MALPENGKLYSNRKNKSKKTCYLFHSEKKGLIGLTITHFLLKKRTSIIHAFFLQTGLFLIDFF